MLTIIELAVLSCHVYRDETKLNFHPKEIQYFTKLPSQFSGWTLVTDVDLNLTPSNHFYAALYIKFSYGKPIAAVVAVRGTVFEDYTNDLVNGFTWLSDVLGDGSSAQLPPGFFQLLLHFVFASLKYITRYFPPLRCLHITGHSLGGALAQLVPLQANLPCPVVAFNAPGVGHLPGVRAEKQGYVTHVNARYDLVSRIGKIIGKTYLIDVPEQADAAAALLQAYHVDDYVNSVFFYALSHSAAGNSLPTKILFNAAGLRSRLASFKSISAMGDSWPAIKTQVQHCVEAANTISIFTRWGGFAAHQICKNKIISNEIIKTLKAQHSIENLINVLWNYKAIAYKSC